MLLQYFSWCLSFKVVDKADKMNQKHWAFNKKIRVIWEGMRKVFRGGSRWGIKWNKMILRSLKWKKRIEISQLERSWKDRFSPFVFVLECRGSTTKYFNVEASQHFFNLPIAIFFDVPTLTCQPCRHFLVQSQQWKQQSNV